MALARAALLAALALAADCSWASPLSKVTRRLSEDALPASCFVACPCLSRMIQEMAPPQDEDDNDEQSVDNAEAVCEWSSELRCLREHPNECAGAGAEVLELSERASCVCDACPDFPGATADFSLVMTSVLGSALGGLAVGEPAGGQQTGGEMEVMMCRYKSAMECLESTPECAGMMSEMMHELPSTQQRRLSGTMDTSTIGNWSMAGGLGPMDNWSTMGNSTNWPGDIGPMDNWSTWNWTMNNWSTWNWPMNNWSTWNGTGGNWSTWNWPMGNWSMANGTGIDFHIDVLSILDNLTCPEPVDTTQPPPAPEAGQSTCLPYSGSGEDSTTGSGDGPFLGSGNSGNGPTTASSEGPDTGTEGPTTTASSPEELISGAPGGRPPPRLALAPLLALLAGLAK